jgi:hypothetical protein
VLVNPFAMVTCAPCGFVTRSTYEERLPLQVEFPRRTLTSLNTDPADSPETVTGLLNAVAKELLEFQASQAAGVVLENT